MGRRGFALEGKKTEEVKEISPDRAETEVKGRHKSLPTSLYYPWTIIRPK